MAELEARGFEVVERYGCPTLKDCVGVVHLRIESLQDIGDHDLALCGAPPCPVLLCSLCPHPPSHTREAPVWFGRSVAPTPPRHSLSHPSELRRGKDADVLAYDTFEGNGDPLYTGTLRSMGLLT
jgi:hypothetical protein